MSARRVQDPAVSHDPSEVQDDDRPLLLAEESGDPSKTTTTAEDSEDLVGEKKTSPATVTKYGLSVLLLLALHNCFHTILMRWIMQDRPKFLTSAAVLSTEVLKFTVSVLYIVFYEGKSVESIRQYLKEDHKNTMLLIVPASAYNLQRSLEYFALANLSAPIFSVVVQSKIFFTAIFSMIVLKRRLKIVQIISLVLLVAGVVLCNLTKVTDSAVKDSTADEDSAHTAATRGVLATLTIAASSGLASVYTEKVIKAQRGRTVVESEEYGLAYTQVQLALVSFAAIGAYAVIKDSAQILKHGLFHNFTAGAFVTVADSALGGLIVAAVLKYADSVLKGYATSLSVILTGFISIFLFGTSLSTIYFMGIVNVVTAVVLYNGQNLDYTVGCYR